jgi:HPt (histidine-containing phosphotransfer) domain-containing protein
MRATRSPARTAANPVPSVDSFEEIRAAFCLRLQSERLHFAALNEALGLAEEIPTPILDDLRNRAHRLCGTAAIFEFSGISAAARELERSATAAAVASAPARNSERGVSTALAALVSLIADLKKNSAHKP